MPAGKPLEKRRPPTKSERYRRWGELAGLAGTTLSVVGTAVAGPVGLAFGAAGAAARYGLGAMAERKATEEKVRLLAGGFIKGVSARPGGIEGHSRVLHYTLPSAKTRELLAHVKASPYTPPTQHTLRVFKPEGLKASRLRQIQHVQSKLKHEAGPVTVRSPAFLRHLRARSRIA